MKYKNIMISVVAALVLSYVLSVSAMKHISPEKQMLFEMCAKGDIAGVSRLINAGVDVNSISGSGRTPLHMACELGNKSLVQYLVEHGADIYAIDMDLRSPREIASLNRYKDIVNYLVAVEKSLNKSNARTIEQKSLIAKQEQQQRQIANIPPQKIKTNQKQKKIKFKYVPKVPIFTQDVHSVKEQGNQQSTSVQIKKEKSFNNQKISNTGSQDIVVQTSQQQDKKKIKKNKTKPKKQKKNKKNNKAQAIQVVPVAVQNVAVAQVPHTPQSNITIVKNKNAVYIYQGTQKPNHYFEIILRNECQNCLLDGMYYKSRHGLVEITEPLFDKNGKQMQDPLYDLEFSNDIVTKIHNDPIRHGFPKEVETAGVDFARVIIANPINNVNELTSDTKKFKLNITIPGEINEFDDSNGEIKHKKEYKGVFEFTVLKNLYDKKGLCVHRFFAPKGVVGAEEFGAKARAKAKQQKAMYQ